MTHLRPGCYVLHGMQIDNVTLPEAVASVMRFSRSPVARLVVTPNSDHFLRWQRSADFRTLYAHASLVVPDGFPLTVMARLAGQPEATRVTGVDLFMAAMDQAVLQNIPVAIIGGKDGVAATAASNLVRDRPGLRFFLLESPAPEELDDETYVLALADRLAAEPRKIVALCLGSPKQEQLFDALSRDTRLAGCFLAVGAAVDFAAGTARRAPAFMQKHGLEWMFRLAQEPQRLWRRYLLDNTRILPYVLGSATAGMANRGHVIGLLRKASLAAAALAIPAAGAAKAVQRDVVEHKKTVLQIGPDARTQGGMASVIAEYLTFGMGRFQMAEYATWSPGSKARSLLKTAKLGLAMLFGKHTDDVFHVHVSESGSFVREGAVVVLARVLGIPTCVSLHGADFNESLAKHPRLTRAVLSRASRLICLGPKQKDLVDSTFPNVPSDIVFNPSGPYPTPTQMDPNAVTRQLRHFVFAGEVGTRKGFDLVTEAWSRLAIKYPDIWLHICGPIADLPEPRNLRQSSYHGTVSRQEIQTLLKNAEALLLPSRREVLPMSVLEALRLGIPVVVSHAGELDSVAASSAVYYCELRASSLEKAIEQVLETTPDHQAARSNAAASWSATHTSNESVAARLEFVYSQMEPRHRQNHRSERIWNANRDSNVRRADA